MKLNYKHFRLGLKYFLTSLDKEYNIETVDYCKKERNGINTEYVSADCFGLDGRFTIDGSFDFNSFSLKLFNYIRDYQTEEYKLREKLQKINKSYRFNKNNNPLKKFLNKKD